MGRRYRRPRTGKVRAELTLVPVDGLQEQVRTLETRLGHPLGTLGEEDADRDLGAA